MKINWTKASCVLIFCAYVALAGFLGGLWGRAMDAQQAGANKQRAQVLEQYEAYLNQNKKQ